MSFSPSCESFDPATALHLGIAASIAYEKAARAKERAGAELGLTEFFEPFEHKNFAVDTQGFVAASREHVVLAFRGTQQPSDWATDALAGPVEFRWFFDRSPDIGRVHAGFANSLSDAWQQQIVPLLRRAKVGTSRKLWITGHSLGGALSVLAAGACIFSPSSLLPVSGIYTFGQPRTALRDFALHFGGQLGAKCFRFVNDRDLVPRLPPRAFDYHHIGRLIHFDRKGRATTGTAQYRSWLMKAYDSISGVVADFLRSPELIADHDLAKGYIPRLRALAADETAEPLY